MAFKGKPILLERLLSLCCGQPLNPNWHEGRHFPPPVLFGPDFVSWIFTKKFQTFWRWKLTSIGLIWHPTELIKSYKNAPRWRLRFQSSCQWGLRTFQPQASTPDFLLWTVGLQSPGLKLERRQFISTMNFSTANFSTIWSWKVWDWSIPG